MRSWSFVLLFISCVATLFQLGFSNAAPPQHTGPREEHVAPRVSIPPGADQEIRRVEREVDQIEQQALAEWRALPITPPSRMDQVRVLGKLLLFDKNLSV